MRIFIATMEEPCFIIPMMNKLIDIYKKDIVGIAVAKGSPIKTKKRDINIIYLINFILILGVINSIRIAMKIVLYHLLKKFKFLNLSFVATPIEKKAEQHNIRLYRVNNINNPDFLRKIRRLKIDIVFNQVQFILKRDFLIIPRYGVINRHAGLLPKYKGRLALFWALLNNEKEVGVTIHYVNERIDSGRIIVQKKISIEKDDNFMTLMKKCFNITPELVAKAIDKIRNNEELPYFDNSESSYYSTPTFKNVLRYRYKMLKRHFTKYNGE